jgi:hypothetical protein
MRTGWKNRSAWGKTAGKNGSNGGNFPRDYLTPSHSPSRSTSQQGTPTLALPIKFTPCQAHASDFKAVAKTTFTNIVETGQKIARVVIRNLAD